MKLEKLAAVMLIAPGMIALSALAAPKPPETVTFEESGEAEAAPSVELPAWTPPEDWEAVSILGSSRAGRLFFDEYLPGVLSRTLSLNDKPPGKGEVRWVLTGPRAGLTVAIREGSVELHERYYDSFGLHPPDLEKYPRSPQTRRRLSRVRYSGALDAITLTLDHRASAELLLNGQSVYRGRFAEDLSRHQLRVEEDVGDLHWRMLRPRPRGTGVTVEPNERKQTIIGFGGIASIPAYYRLSDAGKKRWWQLLHEYGLNIQREYPAGRTLKPDYSNLGSLDAAIHHYYDDNFPNGETVDFEYLRLHRRIPGSQVWFEYWWHLPPWTTGKADEYASSVIEYCRRVKEHSGRAPEILGVQNEKLAENWREMAIELRRHLNQAGFQSSKIHMNDHGAMRKGLEWLEKYRAKPEAWEAIDYTASHQYDYQQFFEDPDQYDATLLEWRRLSGEKPFLSTELCVNHSPWQLPSFRLAFQMAQQYHKTLTLAEAVAVCYCWLLLDVEQQSFNWTRTLFYVDRQKGFVPSPSSHQLRCYGAYSRRIRKGMTRVSAKSTHPDLLVSAYQGDGGRATVVMINRSTRPLEVRVEGFDTPFETLERASPYQPNTVEAAPTSDTRVRIDPGSLVTLSNVALMAVP